LGIPRATFVVADGPLWQGSSKSPTLASSEDLQSPDVKAPLKFFEIENGLHDTMSFCSFQTHESSG
jgi:hypothetical protein